MSRHRDVRNIKTDSTSIGKLLDDDEAHDEHDEMMDMTDEQRDQMDAGIEHIRSVLGSEQQSGLSDATIEEVLWEYYFDVQKALDWLLQEQERRRVAQERKDNKDLPPLPHPPLGAGYNRSGDLHSLSSDNSSSSSGAGNALLRLSQARASLNGVYGRANMPLIHLAQNPQDFPPGATLPDFSAYPPPAVDPNDYEYDPYNPAEGQYGEYDYYEPSYASTPESSLHRLSTISERTEQRTVESGMTPRPSAVPMRSMSFRQPSQGTIRRQSEAPVTPMVYDDHSDHTSVTTDYGEVIETNLGDDPNDIPPSPSLSALQRLSIYEPPPSNASSVSRSSRATPPPPMPPIENIPDIPDASSKGSRQPLHQQPAPPPPPSVHLKPASDRSQPRSMPPSQPRSIPEPVPQRVPQPHLLAPSAAAPSTAKKSKLSTLASTRASTMSQSSRSFSIDETIATYPNLRPATASMLSLKTDKSRVSSGSTDVHVQRAIAEAIEREQAERAGTSGKGDDIVFYGNGSDGRSVSSKSSQSTVKASPQAQSPPSQAAPMAEQPKLSKLAMLAQAKAAEKKGPWMPTAKVSSPVRAAPKAHPMQEPKTELLIPIANGASVTTAITTSYQTLGNLTPPSRSAPPVVSPIARSPSASAPASGKQSKLAMKSKLRATKPSPSAPDGLDGDGEPVQMPVELPIFFPHKTASRSGSRKRRPDSARRRSRERTPDLNGHSNSKARLHTDGDGAADRNSKQRSSTSTSQRRAALYPPPPEHILSAGSFTFDSPSPDDVVFKARQGTSLSNPAAYRDPNSHPKASRGSRAAAAPARSSIPVVPHGRI